MKIDDVTYHPVSQQAAEAMQRKLDQLAKPVAGLGRLEELADRLAGILGTTAIDVAPRKCLVFAADHGVADEGVSATPQKVTAIQAMNAMAGHTTVAALAQAYHCDLEVVDLGIRPPFADARVLDRRIRPMTGNLRIEPAMTLAEAHQAVQTGFDRGQVAFAAGYQVIAIGELGIANTTAAAAMVAALLPAPPVQVVGRGSNISQQRLAHKVQVVTDALQRAQLRPDEPLRVLSEVGGLEIGAMAGAILAGVAARRPVILDGFLAYAAALLANTMVPGAVDYTLPAHKSNEHGSSLVLDRLGLTPYLELNLCVGEGSGAMLLLPLLDGIHAVLTEMNTLSDMAFDFTP